MSDERREQFEKFARDVLAYDSHDLRRDDIGHYRYCEVQSSWKSWQAAYDAGLEAAAQRGEEIAQEVGGKFWQTHRLNTGLLKAIAAIRSMKREGQ